MMSENLAQALRLLKDDTLVWSADFEAVRRPLADLLTLLEQSPSHQFDEPLEGILRGLSTPARTDALEAWLEQSLQAQGIGEPARDALKRLFLG
jgi:hypothetical protein